MHTTVGYQSRKKILLSFYFICLLIFLKCISDNFKITGRNVFVPKQDLYAKCKTKTGEQCQFPFKHKGELHYGCPPDPVEAGERWCSTKVDKDGNHITGKGFYGLCKKECPNHKPGNIFYKYKPVFLIRKSSF